MVLLDTAISLFEEDKTEDEIREVLRGTLLHEDFPTSGYVEEVIWMAKAHFLSQKFCGNCNGSVGWR